MSPADRFARSRDQAAHPHFTEFAATRPFALDPFQIEACRALEQGRGVLVCAPTGAGKTVVGEFAVHRALAIGGKCFYTTPIKALSNQKYADLVAQYGPAQVGLLTGDTSINSHAPVVVMTTEVLRNMLYADSADLHGLTAVVMDEIHYLADKFRGAVWEEVILHLDEGVQVVGLSATVSNAEEFGAWLQAVRGHTTVVVDEIRPVPLWQHMMVGRRMFDLFTGTGADGPADSEPGTQHTRIDPTLARAVADAEALAGRSGFRGGQRGQRGAAPSGGGPRWRPPARTDVIERLDGAGLLPAITFIFSRAGCDAAVTQCVRSGMRLTTESERETIRQVVDRRTADLPEGDLAVLGYWEWREALERGIAAHHAGMLPAFKETVEELFVAGLVKAVFATETLALGINMPARTVVLEKLVKYNGEGHVDLTPGEYTQLTGRAGRRGIDVEGHAVVVWSPGIDPRAVAGLASKRTYPLRSSFRPSYNMAVNLVHRMGREAAKDLLEQSFAQFQADAGVVSLARQVRRNADAVESYAEKMVCHLGDTAEYLGLLEQLAGTEKSLARAGATGRRDETTRDLGLLRRGDVVSVPTGRRAGLAVVLDPGVSHDGTARPLVCTAGRWAGRLSTADFRGPVPSLGRLKLGKFTDHKSAGVRRDLAAAIAASGIRPPTRPQRPTAVEDADVVMLRRTVRAHPVHGCADREQHLQWARRWSRMRHENTALDARVHTARGSLGKALEQILALLESRGYVRGDQVTPAGTMLSRIWSESDLVVAECLRQGIWTGLEPADLASVVSVLVYEARREGAPMRAPGGATAAPIEATHRVWTEIVRQEGEHRLPPTREPDPGFAGAVGAWARGSSLAEALTVAIAGGAELSAGDFVRWCRQVIDLLDQLSGVAPAPLDTVARTAVAALRRGVVSVGAV
ncbi:DEAD/DEAH box helicase [Nakamurella flavida]|uniref:DEAD/DEAH box helicase n=1 Tax=Nakamurella flavida TaxID=363630 RepID=A0A938YGA8_9ACTN|nr:DEAD/DEAH box helicase [Nakamurella flavida]MBM9475372.1 DEAD/DEAH box helicase [Nakamurella flavida]